MVNNLNPNRPASPPGLELIQQPTGRNSAANAPVQRQARILLDTVGAPSLGAPPERRAPASTVLEVLGSAPQGAAPNIGATSDIPVAHAAFNAASGAHAAISITDVNMSHLPADLQGLHENLGKMKDRPVNTEAAAEVINAVRLQSMAAHSTPGVINPATSNKDLVERITEDQVAKWNSALGLKTTDVDAMKTAAFWSGMGNPYGGDPMVGVTYMATPLIGAATGNPLVSLAVGLTSAVVTPFVNAYLQSGVVTRGDIYRESKGPTVVLNKNDVNDNLSLQQAADNLAKCTEDFAAAALAFESKCKTLPPSTLNLESFDLRHLDQDQRNSMKELAERVLTTNKNMCDAQQQTLMTQGSHARQQEGNANQMIPRVMRPVVAGGLNFLNGSEKSGRSDPLSDMGPAGLQSGAAAAVMFAQHYAAGLDERNKQMYNNKLNMLYADVFKETGKAKIAAGEALTGTDIDPAKLRKLVSSPSEAFVVRVTDTVKALRDKVEKDIVALAPGDVETGSQGADNPVVTHPLEVPFGDGSTPSATAPAPQRSETTSSRERLLSLESKRRTLDTDLASLKGGKLTELSTPIEGDLEAGVARKIIKEGLASLGQESSLGMRKLYSPFKGDRSDVVNAALDKKYDTPGEYAAQAIQRLGQAFHLGVFGSAAASVIGRTASTVVGGSSKASNLQLLITTLTSGALGAVGASNQYVAISEKNHFRANQPDPTKPDAYVVTSAQQLYNGATALVRETVGMRATNSEITSANQKINDALTILHDVRYVASAV